MKHAVFESASNFAVGQSNPSCQRNVFINLRSKYAPACSAGRVRTLQLPSSPPSRLYLLGSERNTHTCRHAHVHACTHAHTHHEVSHCLKPFCGLWQQGLWKFADSSPEALQLSFSSAGTGCLMASVLGRQAAKTGCL